MFLFESGDDQFRLRDLRFRGGRSLIQFLGIRRPPAVLPTSNSSKQDTVFCYLLSVPRNFGIITHIGSRFERAITMADVPQADQYDRAQLPHKLTLTKKKKVGADRSGPNRRASGFD